MIRAVLRIFGLRFLDYIVLGMAMFLIKGERVRRWHEIVYPAVFLGLISSCLYWFLSGWRYLSECNTFINILLYCIYFSRVTGKTIGNSLGSFLVIILGLFLLRQATLFFLGTFMNETLLEEPDVQSVEIGRYMVYVGMRVVDLLIILIIHDRTRGFQQSQKEGLRFPQEGVWQWGIVFVLFLTVSQLMLYRVNGHAPFLKAYSMLFLLFGVSWTMLLVLLYNYKDRQKRIQILEEKNQVLIQHIKEREEKERESNAWKHDLKYRLDILYKKMKEQDPGACEYFSSIYGKMEEYDNKLWCRSTLVNGVLNDKLSTARKKQISVTEDIDYFSCPIKEEDLCVILSNLLDNAIEAAVQAEDPRIGVSVRVRDGKVRIQISNTFGSKPIEKNGMLLTSKKAKRDHGWGITNVTMLAEKNKAAFGYEYDDHVFYARLIL